MESLRQDLRYGLRLLRRSPGFAVVAILTLGLGIGATVAVFSIVDATLLRPLPYRDPARLVDVLDRSARESGLSKLFASYADFREYRQHSRSFEDLAAATWAVPPETMTGHGPARDLLAIPVSESFFRMLGVSPQLGRAFTVEDLSRGCSVVLSHGFWTAALGGDPRVVGQSIALDRRPCAVLGVMPAGFAFYPDAAQLWTLLTPDFQPPPETLPVIPFGRLRPNVAPAQAQAELAALHTALHRDDAKERELTPAVDNLQDEFIWLAGRNLRSTLLVLLGAVSLVLLVACWNVAGLLLGRGYSRRGELAVRAALGGGRARIFRQLLVEALLLSSAGGALGILTAFGLVRWFRAVNPVELPPGAQVHVSLPVLAFAAATALAATLFFAVAPAWKISRVDLIDALKSGGRGMAPGRHRLGRLLVAAEMAGSVLLLAGAGLLMESVLRMQSAPLGFDPTHVFHTHVALNTPAYRDAAARVRFYDRLLDRLSAPGEIAHAALTSTLPPQGGGTEAVRIQDQPVPADRAIHDVGERDISPGYFQTMRLALLRGREFDSHDRADAPSVAIINQALAREYFPHADPLGRRIRLDDASPWSTIVGVAATEKHTTVYREMSWVEAPLVYRPVAQTAPRSETIAVRTASDAAPVEAILRGAVASIDPEIALDRVQPLTNDLTRVLAYPRFRAAILAGFAAFALLLAAIGLEGVLAQMVARRTQEVGIRMALGARPAGIVRLIAVEGGVPVLAGLAAGIAAAVSFGRVLESMLYGVRSDDPATLAAIALVLLFTAALAILLPACRAARIDPIAALRAE